MAGTESTVIYAIGGGFLLLTLILLFMMYLLMKKVSDLEDANDGVLSKLNISQKKGEAGEQLVASVTSSLIDAGILEQDVSLADKKSMDFASVIGTTEDGGTIYLPIDSKVNKRPTAVLDEIKKYIGRSYGDGIRTTPFAIIAYPDDEEGKYRKKRADAKKESVFFVRLSTLAPYLLFIRWYNDNIAPLQSANSKIAEALIVFRNHHATVEKEAYEVKQKLEKLIETIKYAPVGENLRHALQLAGIDSLFNPEGEEEMISVFKSLLNSKSVGIVVVDSTILSTLPERLRDQLSASVSPTVLGIGTEEDTTLRDTIRKAIGVDLWK